MGNFKFESNDIIHKGFFSIYQAKNGAIYLCMGNKFTVLSLSQIKELSIDCYNLTDFDSDDFNKYYNKRL